MAQRLKSRRPDQERYIPRSMRNENSEKPILLNSAEKVEIDDIEKTSFDKSKSKSNKQIENCEKVCSTQKVKKTKTRINSSKQTKEKPKEMVNNTEKVDDNSSGNTDDCLVEKMDTLSLSSDSLNEKVTENVSATPSSISSEDPIDVTIEVNETLFKAACSVSNLLCDLIFTSVYKSVSKKKHNRKVIEKCSSKISSQVLQDSYGSSLPGIKKSKQKLKQTNSYSEMLSHNMLKAAFKGINDTKKKQAAEYPPPQALSKELHMQLMIPEIATNIINIAIENAIEISKASLKEEAKSPKKNVPLEKEVVSCETDLSASLDESKTDDHHLYSNSAAAADVTGSNERTCHLRENKTPDKSELDIRLAGKDDITYRLNPPLDGDDVSSGGTESVDDKCKDTLSKKEDANLHEKNNEQKKKKKKDVNPSKATRKKKKNKPVQESNSNEDSTATDVTPLPCVEGQTHDECVTGGEDEEEDSWFSNYTEDGECLTKESYEQSVLDDTECSGDKNGQVINYMEFSPKDIVLDIGEFGHVLELYDFSTSLKSSDINIALKAAGINDYSLHWVDASHALAVFASKVAAHSAMKKYTPVLQMRQVVNGTRQSRIKIKDLKDVLLPYKKRPQTTSMVARNLVAGSLGLRSNTTKEQRDKEKEMLRKAREEKRLKEKKRRDIWDSPDGN